MVIWMWCLPPMDDHDGGPLRAAVSMFRFPTARTYIYIVCVLASRLLYWVQMFSGLGILVAPRSSTFLVVLGGITASTSSFPVKKPCLTLLKFLWFRQIAARLLINVLFYRMVRASMPPPENPMLGEALAAVAQGTAAIMQLLQNQGGQRGDRPQHTILQPFLAISPPRFVEARYPLEADDWLAEIKKHFTANSVRCNIPEIPPQFKFSFIALLC